ncbi:hypothetical protein NKI19_05190 [Mesorhizobium sp. M0751]
MQYCFSRYRSYRPGRQQLSALFRGRAGSANRWGCWAAPGVGHLQAAC